MDGIRAEQKSLAAELARQNRRAATVTPEMYIDCQVHESIINISVCHQFQNNVVVLIIPSFTLFSLLLPLVHFLS